jgi:hypothetical protein
VKKQRQGGARHGRNTALVVKPKGGLIFNRTSLELPKGLTYAEWYSLKQHLEQWEAGIQWYIGDYLNYGEHAYGEKYAQAVGPEQAATWRHYAWVAASLEMCLRKHNLSYKHHEVVAPLPPTEQTQWLELAAKSNPKWSVHELRSRIRDAKRLNEKFVT